MDIDIDDRYIGKIIVNDTSLLLLPLLLSIVIINTVIAMGNWIG